MLLPQTRTKGTGIGEDLAARMPVIFKFCKDRDRDMEKGAAILADTLSSASPHIEDRQVGVRGTRCSEKPGSESLRVDAGAQQPKRIRCTDMLRLGRGAGPRVIIESLEPSSESLTQTRNGTRNREETRGGRRRRGDGRLATLFRAAPLLPRRRPGSSNLSSS